MVHRQQIKSPSHGTHAASATHAATGSQGAGNSVGHCTTWHWLTFWSHCIFCIWLLIPLDSIIRIKKRRISVNLNESEWMRMNLHYRIIRSAPNQVGLALRFSLIAAWRRLNIHPRRALVCKSCQVGYQRGSDLFGLEPLHWRCGFGGQHVTCATAEAQSCKLLDLHSLIPWKILIDLQDPLDLFGVLHDLCGAHLENRMILKDLESS